MENKLISTVQGMLIDALLRALAKQPGIDAVKLAQDISASLVSKEVSAEDKAAAAGAGQAAKLARVLAHAALPGLQIY